MGGIGSGKGFRFDRKRTKDFVESYKCLDARSFPYRVMTTLPAAGVRFSPHDVELHIFKDKIEVLYQVGGERRIYKIPLSVSPGNYGNSRYWLICPIKSCSKRVRKLYLTRDPDDMPLYLCRHCLKLVYRSQNRTELNRIIDRKWALVHQLGSNSDLISDREKPKWMHWKIFNRIREEIEYLNDEAERGICLMFGYASMSEAFKKVLKS
jgi:hypothetical protein